MFPFPLFDLQVTGCEENKRSHDSLQASKHTFQIMLPFDGPETFSAPVCSSAWDLPREGVK